jgi:hypothetical protein
MDRQLSSSEEQALIRLRKVQSQWPTLRWVLLFLGASNILSGLSSYFRHGEQAFGVLAMTIGFVALLLAWRDWSGNASRTLLLKIYEND